MPPADPFRAGRVQEGVPFAASSSDDVDRSGSYPGRLKDCSDVAVNPATDRPCDLIPLFMPSGPSLDELCRRLKASDREAFAEIFRRFRADLLRFATSIVEDAWVAHDLVQDVFVALWNLRATLDPSLPLRPYLFKMTRNRAYRYLRDERTHARKHAELSSAARDHPPDDAMTEHEHDGALLHRKLTAWIDALPARQREALLLARYHALSHQEIATVMGISPRTVNNHIVRALEHLQRCVEAFEPTLLER